MNAIVTAVVMAYATSESGRRHCPQCGEVSLEFFETMLWD